MAKLLEYAWPGNVRELAHAVERVVLLGKSAEVHAADLPPSITSAPAPGLPAALGGGGRAPHPRSAAPLRRVGARAPRRPQDAHRRGAGVDAKTLSKWLASQEDEKA